VKSAIGQGKEGWPTEMTISVEIGPLCELLYVRSTRALCTSLQFPELNPPPGRRVDLRTVEARDLSRRWDREWDQALSDLIEDENADHQGVISRKRITATLSAERKPPAGWEAADDRVFRQWLRGIDRAKSQPMGQPPEWLVPDDVAEAWQVGYRKCVVLPFEGSFGQRVGEHILLVSPMVRDTPREYSVVLRALF